MDYNLEISNLIIDIANLADAPRKLKVSEESLQNICISGIMKSA